MKKKKKKNNKFTCTECVQFYDALGINDPKICKHVSRHKYESSSSDSAYWNLDSIPSPLLATQYRDN